VINAVLFDLDGTFADTAPDLAAALNYVRATRHLPPLPFDLLRPQASHGSRGLLKVGFDIEPQHPDYNTLRDELLNYYANNICINTNIFNGIKCLVKELSKYKIKWGIVTNKPHYLTVPLMEQLGYAQHAACLVSGDTCEHAKPHPMSLLHAAQLIGTNPANCIYLGDDLRDMQAANAANMRGIIANHGYVSSDVSVENWQAHGSINHPMELIAYLDL